MHGLRTENPSPSRPKTIRRRSLKSCRAATFFFRFAVSLQADELEWVWLRYSEADLAGGTDSLERFIADTL